MSLSHMISLRLFSTSANSPSKVLLTRYISPSNNQSHGSFDRGSLGG